ncbi:DUF1847 domain-containing protein [Seleniivibrio woodruffii]|uniref:Putative metal-binding protein n=1 Tax=Seleniivibrio woodruffii TaxID=1078050 RepID=A0A4R1K7U5_9BACT|nr:DUF1847 domain-containing protein [Seleniivibrio woodruffii]TCK59873.1 putative metal-binding protein [Seleniivibrio woodruffii]TVZ35906.1 putative metal-binding protein [Seleniivibrio woodruffii]
MSAKLHDCSVCGSLNCYKRESQFPAGCPTANLDESLKNEVLKAYFDDDFTREASRASAEVEGKFYGKLTRIEEIAEFAKRMGYKTLGIASCVGLAKETAVFAKFLRSKGFEVHDFICKIGSVDKTEGGIPDGDKIAPGNFEAMCNPALQARLLAEHGTEYNIIVGLCVGHDSIFIHHSKVPVTYFIVKDRVLAHNPAAAVYTCASYYKKIFD